MCQFVAHVSVESHCTPPDMLSVHTPTMALLKSTLLAKGPPPNPLSSETDSISINTAVVNLDIIPLRTSKAPSVSNPPKHITL